MPFGIGFNLFGDKNTEEAQQESAKELVRSWQRKLRAEARVTERSIREIEREEEKVKKQCKDLARKQGDPKSIQLLAKSLVRSNKAKERLYTSRAVMQSADAELGSMAATMRMASSMTKSAEVMGQINALVKVPEIQESMTSMRREMIRAGLVDEIIEESMEGMDGPDLEEEAEEEVDRVLDELAIDASMRMAAARPQGGYAAAAVPAAPAQPAARTGALASEAG